METFSTSLSIFAGNSPVTGEFPAQRPVTRSFDVFFEMCLNKSLSKQRWGWSFETLFRPLWRHCNGLCASPGLKYLSVWLHFWDWFLWSSKISVNGKNRYTCNIFFHWAKLAQRYIQNRLWSFLQFNTCFQLKCRSINRCIGNVSLIDG